MAKGLGVQGLEFIFVQVKSLQTVKRMEAVSWELFQEVLREVQNLQVAQVLKQSSGDLPELVS